MRPCLSAFLFAAALAAFDVAAPAQDRTPKVQVFLLMGQSNMVGFGRIADPGKKGTLEQLCKEGRYSHLRDETGAWVARDDVWCVKTTVGQKQGWLQPGFGARNQFFGPELQFGHVVGDAIDAPVLIIKASQGNRSLGWDILPPGSERFEHSGRIYAGYKDTPDSWVEGEPKKAVNWYAGKQYDDFVRDIHEVLGDLPKFFPSYRGQDYEIAGFAWWQGHKDQNAAHASRYEQNLVRLIDCLRQEFDAPKAPFVLATIGFEGSNLKGHGLTVLEAQLAVSGETGKYPQFAGNVKTIDARPFWRDKDQSPNQRQGYHYWHNAETYMEVGDALGKAMVELLQQRAELPRDRAPRQRPADRRDQPAPSYADLLATLRSRIAASLPAVDTARQQAFLRAHTAEADAKAAVDAARKAAERANAAKDATQKEVAARASKEAEAAFAAAEQTTLAAARAVLADLGDLLRSDAVDARLVQGAVLANATPRGLTAFAAQGAREAELVEALLHDGALMRQMLVADGAKAGNYGRAAQIYADIRQASRRAGSGILQRLALGTALEHAVPVKHFDQSTTVDPVQRYLHYERAFLAGELDPAVPDLTTWECRLITNSDATDEQLAWGREMLRNYRPDIVFEADYRWRYVKIVKTDVAYKTPAWTASPHTYQQIVDGGGKCGPRAWFGRFALRCFGIPTWGVRQRGHAALSHWTPDGWAINYGAAWKHNWWEGRPGPDFLLETQARRRPAEYLAVLRAQWIGDVLGEAKVEPMHPGSGGFWHALALNAKRAIVADAGPAAVALAGEDLAEADEPTRAEAILQTSVTTADTEIVEDADGTITIPAVACSAPQQSTKKIRFMRSFAGGMQLHYNRLGGAPEAFEYVVEARRAGRYALAARVVTVNRDQQLRLSVNAAATPIDLALPYTVGAWQETAPVAIELARGRNVLRFTRDDKHCGVSIQRFVLRPVE